MPVQRFYTADRIFTGDDWLEAHAIVIENEIISGIVPASFLPDPANTENFPEDVIVPAFIDLQIYGAYGKLLAVYPEADSLYKLNDHCRKSGTAHCLPTVATNTKEVFFKSIDAVRNYWKEDGTGILGLHFEGPWINALKRGAHIEELIHPPSLDEVQELIDYGSGIIRMITLAPETCSDEVIEFILSHGIIISAGH